MVFSSDTMHTNNQPEIKAKIPGKNTGIEIRKTICAICEGGSTSCGINAYVKDGKVIKVEGMSEFPHNRGSLCAKGNSSRQYIYNKERILSPLKRTGPRGTGQFTEIGWDEAYKIIAENLLGIKGGFGAESVVFGAGYTKWLRPFAQRLALSFGSPNFATESSTCHFATKIAAKLTYGAWGQPDFTNSKCLLVWSRNLFVSATPQAKRLLAAINKGLKVIEVNPMTTHLTCHASLHLAPRPGTDGALALGMAHVIISEKLYDADFIARWSSGFDEFSRYASRFTPEETERITGVPEALIKAAARMFAGAGRASIMTSASPTVHHTNGVQNHRAIISLSGLTGNFDVPGGNRVVPETWLHVGTSARTREHEFTFPTQLSNLPPRVGQDRFPVWTDVINEAQFMHLPEQIESGVPYPIKALVGFGINHRMWPGCDSFLASLEKLDFIASADLFMTDMAKMSDIVLPACSSFERSELRFYGCNHVIYTRPVIQPLGVARPDSEIIFDLARYIAPEDELLCKGYEHCLDWILEPGGLSINDLKKHPAGISLPARELTTSPCYLANGFNTPSGKMEFHSPYLESKGYNGLPAYTEPGLSPLSTPELHADYPFVLSTGARLPMFIHSRTFRNDWTRALHPKPTVSINKSDGLRLGIENGEQVWLQTPRHKIEVKAELTNSIREGVVTIYHGWSDVEVNWLISPDYLDPISGFPGFKSLLCNISKIEEKIS